jgi:hypothetical protein
MNRFWVLLLLLLLLLPVTSLILGCGSSGRQLQSITIHSVANGQQIQFVAAGTFSASPTTVSPLAVSWSFAPPGQYSLTTQPFLFDCEHPESPGPIVAAAPADPYAPSSGSMSTTRMISTSGPIPCP